MNRIQQQIQSGKAKVSDVRKAIRAQNRKFPKIPVRIPPDQWPSNRYNLIDVWRSCDFCVQVFDEGEQVPGMVRLSVNRTDIKADGDWKDGITWDELQWLKRFVGYGGRDAVEVYPPENQQVEVANMRHLWVYPEGEEVPFRWRS